VCASRDAAVGPAGLLVSALAGTGSSDRLTTERRRRYFRVGRGTRRVAVAFSIVIGARVKDATRVFVEDEVAEASAPV